MNRLRHQQNLQPWPAAAGSALISTLTLLLVLALLTMGALGSARFDLIMSGNLRWAAEAAALADIGTAHSLATARAAPLLATGSACTDQADWHAAPATVLPYGQWLATTCLLGQSGAADGSSIGQLASWHFRISALGRSSGGAEAIHHQGFEVPAPALP